MSYCAHRVGKPASRGGLRTLPVGFACRSLTISGDRAATSITAAVVDSLLEGSGFELPVPHCALIANSAALVAPPDAAVRGGSLNGRLQPRSVVGRQSLGRPAARMTLIFGVAVTDDVVLSI